MAKKRKSRKSRRMDMPRSVPISMQPGTAAPKGKPAPATAPEPAVSFADEYHYVVRDLKHIGILAAAMFGLLVVLALVL